MVSPSDFDYDRWMTSKPFSQASDNNKDPILDELKRVFADVRQVLEIGSGTGQHAVYFSRHLPHLRWQPSDQAHYLEGIGQWIQDEGGENLSPPLLLDVCQADWPTGFDAAYSANTAHIMPWPVAQEMLRRVALALPLAGVFALYGPFNYNGAYTSESNQRFDDWLKDNEPHQGIRDFEKVNEVACENGLILLEDIAMPANNRLLVWQKPQSNR